MASGNGSGCYRAQDAVVIRMRCSRTWHRHDTGFGEQLRQTWLSPRRRRWIAQLKNAAGEHRETIEHARDSALDAIEAWTWRTISRRWGRTIKRLTAVTSAIVALTFALWLTFTWGLAVTVGLTFTLGLALTLWVTVAWGLTLALGLTVATSTTIALRTSLTGRLSNRCARRGAFRTARETLTKWLTRHWGRVGIVGYWHGRRGRCGRSTARCGWRNGIVLIVAVVITAFARIIGAFAGGIALLTRAVAFTTTATAATTATTAATRLAFARSTFARAGFCI